MDNLLVSYAEIQPNCVKNKLIKITFNITELLGIGGVINYLPKSTQNKLTFVVNYHKSIIPFEMEENLLFEQNTVMIKIIKIGSHNRG